MREGVQIILKVSFGSDGGEGGGLEGVRRLIKGFSYFSIILRLGKSPRFSEMEVGKIGGGTNYGLAGPGRFARKPFHCLIIKKALMCTLFAFAIPIPLSLHPSHPPLYTSVVSFLMCFSIYRYIEGFWLEVKTEINTRRVNGRVRVKHGRLSVGVHNLN